MSEEFKIHTVRMNFPKCKKCKIPIHLHNIQQLKKCGIPEGNTSTGLIGRHCPLCGERRR